MRRAQLSDNPCDVKLSYSKAGVDEERRELFVIGWLGDSAAVHVNVDNAWANIKPR